MQIGRAFPQIADGLQQIVGHVLGVVGDELQPLDAVHIVQHVQQIGEPRCLVVVSVAVTVDRLPQQDDFQAALIRQLASFRPAVITVESIAGRLADGVEEACAIHVEATSEKTEQRILHSLRRRCVGLADRLEARGGDAEVGVEEVSGVTGVELDEESDLATGGIAPDALVEAASELGIAPDAINASLAIERLGPELMLIVSAPKLDKSATSAKWVKAIDALVNDNAYYRSAVIPGGMYRGNDGDTKTFGVGATFVSSAAVPENVIYVVVKSVFENFDDFKKLHPAFNNLNAIIWQSSLFNHLLCQIFFESIKCW